MRRIARTGDSLTVGYATLDGGAFARELAVPSFGPAVFVGGVTGPQGLHEGHGGWRINQIAKNIDGWIASSKPTDVALMIGTNDALSMETPGAALAELRTLVLHVLKLGPRVVLATIPPFAGALAKWNTWAAAYNAGIVQLVRELRAEGYSVELADVDKAVSTADLAADGVHMTPAGYAKIATVMGRATVGTSSKPSSSSSLTATEGILAVVAIVALWRLMKGRKRR